VCHGGERAHESWLSLSVAIDEEILARAWVREEVRAAASEQHTELNHRVALSQTQAHQEPRHPGPWSPN